MKAFAAFIAGLCLANILMFAFFAATGHVYQRSQAGQAVDAVFNLVILLWAVSLISRKAA